MDAEARQRAEAAWRKETDERFSVGCSGGEWMILKEDYILGYIAGAARVAEAVARAVEEERKNWADWRKTSQQQAKEIARLRAEIEDWKEGVHRP